MPPEAVLLDVVPFESVQMQTEEVQMQIEVVLDEIPALGLALGRPTESDANKTRSMTDLLGLESKASKGNPKKKKKSSGRKK